MKLSRELKYAVKQLKRRFQGPLFQAGLAFVFAFLAIVVFASPVGQRLELILLRTFFSLRGPLPAPSDVMLVAIDDRSYQVLGASTNFPLPRRYIATALEVIQAATPKVTILDAKIPEERLIDPQADARIEAALRMGKVSIWDGVGVASAAGEEELALPSEERFRKAATMELPMRLYSSLDQLVYIGNPSPSAAKATLSERVWHVRPLTEIAGIEIPEAGPGVRDLINYYGSPGTINSISLHELVQGNTASLQEKLRDKVVIVGYRSLHVGRGLQAKDEMYTPVSSSGMYGVEIHAHILGNLIERSWLKRLSLENELLFIAISVLILTSFVMRYPRPLTLAVSAFILAVVCVADYLAFTLWQCWLGGVANLVAVFIVAAGVSSVFYFLRSEAYRRYLDQTFSFEREREL
jgi:adenylate cyclase